MIGYRKPSPGPVANHDTPDTRRLIELAKQHGFKPKNNVSFIRGDRSVVFGAKRTTFWTGDYEDFTYYNTETDIDKIVAKEFEQPDVDPFAHEHEQ